MVFILSLIFLSRSNTWQRRGVRESEILKNVHGNVTCDSLFTRANTWTMGKNKCLFALFVIVVFFFVCLFINLFFFSIWISFHQNSRFSVQQEKGEAISITPFYHFHQFHIRLDISEAITAERSPLRKASSRTRTGKLWCPSAGR